MSLKSLARAWQQFFFEKQSPLPIALFRIIYGSLIIITLALLRADWLDWYGMHAWVRLPTVVQLERGSRLNLFSILPPNDAWVEAFFWVALASAILLTVGLFSRTSSILVFLSMTSIQQRNLYIIHGGDTFLRLAGFWLIFAPAGAALSLDHLIRVRRGQGSSEIPWHSPWAQRMIQLQLSFVYLATFLSKIRGAPWIQGTALFYVYHLEELKRFPLPDWFFNPMVLRLGSWSALALEFSLAILIWVKEFRYAVLAIGLGFHLWLEYSLNIPLFQWDILSAYVLFIDAKDLARLGQRVRSVFRPALDRSSLETIEFERPAAPTTGHARKETFCQSPQVK